jgi:hypothetical protein
MADVKSTWRKVWQEFRLGVMWTLLDWAVRVAPKDRDEGQQVVMALANVLIPVAKRSLKGGGRG